MSSAMEWRGGFAVGDFSAVVTLLIKFGKECRNYFRFWKRTNMGKKWGGVDQCPACLKSVYPLNRVRSIP